MSHPFGNDDKPKLIPSIIIGTGSFLAMESLGPVMVEGQINAPAALAAGVFGIAVIGGVRAIVFKLEEAMEDFEAKQPSGKHGDGGFVKSLREIKHVLSKKKRGVPYWGMFKGTPIRAEIETSSLTIGVSGSGKTTRCLLPMILSLVGKDQLIIDYKPEIAPQVIPILKEHGIKVKVINIGNQLTDLVGESDCYNVLDIISDLFFKKGGLREISDIVTKLCLYLYIEPQDGKDQYWRDGSRLCILMAILQVILVKGNHAHLGFVNELINNRAVFLQDMLWASGELTGEGGKTLTMAIESSPWATADIHEQSDIDDFIRWYRKEAVSMAKKLASNDDKSTETFLSGARLALFPYNISSHPSKVTRKSSVRFSELKEGETTVIFLMMDANKADAQASVLGAIIWGFLYEMKAHPCKTREVHVHVDEAGNIPWAEDFGKLVTYSRGAGLRFHFYIQNFFAFKATHSEEALQSVISESEIIRVLPGIKNMEMLRLLQDMFGEKTVVTKTRNNSKGEGENSVSYSETSRPVLPADEIRRSKKGFIQIGDNRVLEADFPFVAEIDPWRDMLAPHPHTGKRFLKRVKVRLDGYSMYRLKRLLNSVKRLFKGGRA